MAETNNSPPKSPDHDEDIWVNALPDLPTAQGSVESIIDNSVKDIPGAERLETSVFLESFFAAAGLSESDAQTLAKAYEPLRSEEEILEVIQKSQGLGSREEAKKWQEEHLAEGRKTKEKVDKIAQTVFSDEMRELLGLPLNASDFQIAKELDKRGYGQMSFEDTMKSLRDQKNN